MGTDGVFRRDGEAAMRAGLGRLDAQRRPAGDAVACFQVVGGAAIFAERFIERFFQRMRSVGQLAGFVHHLPDALG